jgi:hypothetical protein
LQESNMRKLLLISIIVVAGCNQCCGGQYSARDEAVKAPSAPGITYRNPRVYNVDYTFEMSPDPNNIDRAKDLKVWIPIPREWDSQKAVKIISVQPEPHARYVDPEYGNPMLFWDFGKEPEQRSYKVDIKFRLESYEISVEVDPNRVGSYDKTSKEYALYTRSTRTIHITPKIRELAQEAIGDEKNPYLQAKRILEFANKKMRYKILDYERGRGIDCLLAYPVTDEKTGQEYYEGCCTQYTALMVALCRAVGIPARCVSGYIGYNPWVDPNNVKAAYPFEAKLSQGGLAATQLFGGLGSHMWTEFFIANYGWIPADAQIGTIGHQYNQMWIKSKGRDVLVGPGDPPHDSEGYGMQWVSLNDRRADVLGYAVLNIAKIRTSKVTILHHSDPFPADGLAGYGQNLFVLAEQGMGTYLKNWRQEILSWPSHYIRDRSLDNLDLGQSYRDYPRAKDDREVFICHMLRRQLGDEKFFTLVSRYIELRQKSGQAVPTSRFQELAEDIHGEPLSWFFNQWVNRLELPRLKLENVAVRKDNEGWQVQGRLVQSGKAIFRLPLELAIDTKKGREMQKLWIDSKTVDFDFQTQEEPQKLIVDPDYEVLKFQKMPPRLWWFWHLQPEFIVIYGTLGETQANENAAQRFNSDYLGLGGEIVKADTDVNDADLKTKCVFLIGRPETNKVAQQFKDRFPIKLEGAQFAWQGTAYDKPTQKGVAQVIDSPVDGKGLMVMYAGLSPEATLKLCDLELYDSDSSYVIFDGDKQLLIGDWEDVDSNLYWNFDSLDTTPSSSEKRR